MLFLLRTLHHWFIEPFTENYEPCEWCEGAYLGKPDSPRTRRCWVWSEMRPLGRMVRLCEHCRSTCAGG